LLPACNELGDHPLTAGAIARQVGIITKPTRDQVAALRGCKDIEVPDEEVDAVVVKGADLERFTEIEWRQTLLKQEIVFARTTPTQKLEIVSHLQALGM